MDFKKKYLLSDDEQYDLAIDYFGYGRIGSIYIAEHVNAKKKVMFIHGTYMTPYYITSDYFKYYDKFYCVSQSTLNTFKDTFKLDNVEVCHNIIDYDDIINKSNAFDPNYNKNTLNLVTIGNFNVEKGYDLLAEIANQLNLDGIDYKWNIIGEGGLKKKFESTIKKYKIDDKINIIDPSDNPYPYIQYGDVYISTSKSEAYGLTVAEARVLKKPIVATNLDCFKEQIIEGKNGFLCDYDAKAFCDKIEYFKNKKNMKKFLNSYDSNIHESDNMEFKNVLNYID